MSDRNRRIEAELDGLRRYARALAPDRDAAADLVQDTVARALSSWAQWRGDGPLRAWLFTIMRNTFLQSARRDARWRTIEVDDPSAAAALAAPERVDPAAMRELSDALAQLSTEHRELIVLIGVEGFGYAEAAALTGAPIGTVMSRLARARDRLRALTGAGPQEDEA